jgi:hypothetical protein
VADRRPLSEPCVVGGPHPGMAVADLADLGAGGDRPLLQECNGCVRSRRPEHRAGNQRRGVPKYLIRDQEGVFVSDAFRGLLRPWNVRRRFGAVGKHGSIAVTERAILTLKQEWLRRVVVIRGIDHLTQLLDDFSEYYNGWRGHRTLGGAVPRVIHGGATWQRPCHSAKQVSESIQCRFLPDTRTTAYRLAA